MNDTPHLNCTHCPKCGEKMKAVDSRSHTAFGFATVRRRRLCSKCNVRVSTLEVIAEVAEDVFADD